MKIYLRDGCALQKRNFTGDEKKKHEQLSRTLEEGGS